MIQCRRTGRGFSLGMTVPPANPPRPDRNIAIWSGTAHSTRQAWPISHLTSISEGLSPIRHPGTRLVGDGRPTTDLGVACSRIPLTKNFPQVNVHMAQVLNPPTTSCCPAPPSTLLDARHGTVHWMLIGPSGDQRRLCGRLRTLPYSLHWKSSMAGNAEKQQQQQQQQQQQSVAKQALKRPETAMKNNSWIYATMNSWRNTPRREVSPACLRCTLGLVWFMWLCRHCWVYQRFDTELRQRACWGGEERRQSEGLKSKTGHLKVTRCSILQSFAVFMNNLNYVQVLTISSSSSRLYPSTAGCSPPSVSSTVICLLLS